MAGGDASPAGRPAGGHLSATGDGDAADGATGDRRAAGDRGAAGAAPEDPHRSTLSVYEDRAAEWRRRRTPDTAAAAEFAEALAADPQVRDDPVVADLGCGPGWHLAHLPAGTLAVDAAASMLELVPDAAPDAPRVRADLRALPVARGSLDAAWADRSYVHLARGAVPLALWDLHRALRVGAPARLELFEGDLDHGRFADDDTPGRWFSAWPEDLLRHVVEGAGFGLDLLERRPAGDVEHLVVWLRRRRSLADTVGPGMRLLLVGLNPSEYAADAGIPFGRPGNRAWPALAAAGLAGTAPGRAADAAGAGGAVRDPVDLLRRGVGMTDLVKRATPRADELTAEEYAAGRRRLEALCSWLSPAAVCVLGVTGWRAAVDPGAAVGVQDATLGGRPVYVMPNPSGANAHVDTAALAEHLRAASELADRAAPR